MISCTHTSLEKVTKRISRCTRCRTCFGTITEIVKDHMQGSPCEVEFRDEDDKLVGFWAYGMFDDRLPFQGKLEGQINGLNKIEFFT